LREKESRRDKIFSSPRSASGGAKTLCGGWLRRYWFNC